MTTMHIRQCPRCVLRFTSSSELEDHLRNDHRPRQSLDEGLVSSPQTSVESQMSVPVQNVDEPVISPRSHVRAWMSAAAGVLMIALVAWLALRATGLITIALVVLLVVCYQWRARARARLRRRRQFVNGNPVS